MSFVARLDRRWYPAHGDNWDDALFRERILQHVTADSAMLDLGAGAGIVRHMNFRGLARRVCGIDLDPRVTENPYLDEARIAAGEAIPYPDSSFDLAIADNVIEHLEQPQRVFREVARVLRPGGRFLVKTPNKWHYMPLIARATPHAFHRLYNRIRGRAGADTFATHYRANSPSDLRRVATQSGFCVSCLLLIEGRPEYLRISPLTYALGFVYERLVNSWERLAFARVLLIAELTRP